MADANACIPRAAKQREVMITWEAKTLLILVIYTLLHSLSQQTFLFSLLLLPNPNFTERKEDGLFLQQTLSMLTFMLLL